MGRPVPISRVILSDEEVAKEASASGKKAADVQALMIDREANQKAVQAAYDHTPPASVFAPVQE